MCVCVCVCVCVLYLQYIYIYIYIYIYYIYNIYINKCAYFYSWCTTNNLYQFLKTCAHTHIQLEFLVEFMKISQI